MKRVVRLETSVCLHYKVDEQPKKMPKKNIFPKRRESDYKNAAATVKIVLQLGCLARLGAVGFSQRRTGREKPDAKSLGTISKNTIHSVYAASSEYPGKKKGPSFGNRNVKESLRHEI